MPRGRSQLARSDTTGGAAGRSLLASLFLSLAVVAVAVALVIVGTYVVLPRLIPAGSVLASPAFPLAACLVAAVAGLATGMLGGVLPAVRATRLPVAWALRE